MRMFVCRHDEDKRKGNIGRRRLRTAGILQEGSMILMAMSLFETWRMEAKERNRYIGMKQQKR